MKPHSVNHLRVNRLHLKPQPSDTLRLKPLIQDWGKPLRLVGLTIMAAIASTCFSLSAWAQPAMLYASTSDARINIRTRPTTDSTAIYLARPGDSVEIIEQVQGTDGMPWFFVDLRGENVSGWVRGDLVSFDAALTDSTRPIVPPEAQQACINRAFIELDTFRTDIEITDARMTGSESYVLRWQQVSQDLTGQCTVNARNDVVAFVTHQPQTTLAANSATSRDTTRLQPQTTLHDFRTESYSVRLFRVEGDVPSRPYINLWNIDNQEFVLQNRAMQVETLRDVTVYWLEAGGRDYQVRIVPNQPHTIKISTPTAVVYEGTALSD